MARLTWIDKERRARIRMHNKDKGPWTLENFAKSGQESMQAGNEELIDYLNYRKMSWKERKISRRQYERRKEIIGALLHEDKALMQ